MLCTLCSCAGHTNETCVFPLWRDKLSDSPKLPPGIWADWVALALEPVPRPFLLPVRVEHIGGCCGQMKIQTCVPYLLNTFNIKTREELDNWSNEKGAPKQCRHLPFYNEVMQRSKDHWESIKHPRGVVRACYESHLDGFAPKKKSEPRKTYQDEEGLWRTSGKTRKYRRR